MKYELPQLPYEYNALEPHIDAKTMEIHHSKHHQGYTDKLNAVIEKNSSIADRKVEDLLRDLDNLEIDDADKKALRNNGGGYVNHSLFWEIMGKDKDIDEQLVSEIEATFGSTEKFKEQFTEAATTQFGSGWAWLVKNSEDKLEVYGLPNQDSPYLQGHTPIIGLDVWEHAYYLNYQNRRPDYIDAWWYVLKLI